MCIQGKWPFINTRLIRMTSYRGFALCMKFGLELLQSEGKLLSLIIQHDRGLNCYCNLNDIVNTMMFDRTIHYVALATKSMLGIRAKKPTPLVQSKKTLSGRALEPTPFWYDSTHVADISFYLDIVFGWHVFPFSTMPAAFHLKTGDFPEDKFGNHLQAAIRARPSTHSLFGCYILDDRVTIYIKHTKSRVVRSEALEREWKLLMGEEVVVEEEKPKKVVEDDDSESDDGDDDDDGIGLLGL